MKMSGLIWDLSGFDSNAKSWTSYQEHLEQYFLVDEALLTLIIAEQFKFHKRNQSTCELVSNHVTTLIGRTLWIQSQQWSKT